MRILKLYTLLILLFSPIARILGENNTEETRKFLVENFFLDPLPEDPSIEKISSELDTLPKPTGEYQVGVKTFDLIDENRNDRLIPIWVYFPVQKGPQIVFPKKTEKRGLDLFEIRTVWKKLNINTYSQHLDNFRISKNFKKYPVVLFNNGNGMLLSDNAFVLEDLASNGYIVVSIQNQLNIDKIPSSKISNRTVSNWNRVIQNNLYVFDWLTNNNKSIFQNSLDLSKIGLVGYSMGANASMLWADRISRSGLKEKTLFPRSQTSNIKECIVSLDSRRASFPNADDFPILMLIASERKEEQKENGEYDLMQKNGHKFIYYKNTHHGSFSDHAYLNIKTHLSPGMNWYYGSTDERMEFFNKMRDDIRLFLEDNLKEEKN